MKTKSQAEAVRKVRAGQRPNFQIALEGDAARAIGRDGRALARRHGLTQEQGETVALTVALETIGRRIK